MSDVIKELNRIPNIAQFIADRTESMILKGELPPNARLVQNDIADQFGVSRLPVRDALAILLKKNLIRQLPRKGMVVRNIDEKEVNDLFEHRLLIEPYAIRKSLKSLDSAFVQRAELLIDEQSRLDENDIIALLDLDERFHSHLWSRFDNNEILESLSAIWRRIKVVRAYARMVPDWKEKSLAGHRAILESAKKRDYRGVIKWLEKSIARSREEIVEKIRQNEAADSSS